MKLPNSLGEDLSSLNRKVRRESALNLGILLDEARQKRSYEGLKKESLSHLPKLPGIVDSRIPITLPGGFEKKSANLPVNGGKEIHRGSKNSRPSSKNNHRVSIYFNLERKL